MAKLIWVDVGNWENDTLYLRGNQATDTETSEQYFCTTEHTSAAAGTFADERAAHPYWWRLLLQDIPSEYLDAYRKAMSEIIQLHIIRKRYPYRVPTMRSILGHPSPAQLRQREYFKSAVACFNKQPYTGGVAPPAIGPRNRSWWYDAAGGSGLWYYDYFMKQSLPIFGAEDTPDWCKEPITVNIADANHTIYENPTIVYQNVQQLNVEDYVSGPYHTKSWGWIKNPTTNKHVLYIMPFDISGDGKPPYEYWLDIYAVEEDWDPATLCWNNQPEVGALLKSINMYWVPINEFLKIDLTPSWDRICLKHRPDHKCYTMFWGANEANGTKRPYVKAT